MKQPFGAKPAGFYMRSMLWIAANRKKEDAAPVSMIGRNCRPPRIAAVEFRAVEQFGGALPKGLIYNAGTIAGEFRTMLDLCLQMYFLSPGDRVLYSDQQALNFIQSIEIFHS